MLKPDAQDTTNTLLFLLLRQQSNASFPLSDALDTLSSQIEHWTIRVNAVFIAGLSLSLVAVLLAMLAKQWVREYTKSLGTITNEEERAKRREFRFRGVERWHMSGVMSAIPTIIHISLMLFFYGLVDLLSNYHQTMFVIAATILGFGACIYILLIVLSTFFVDCPYKSPFSPVSTLLSRTYAMLSAYHFLGASMSSLFSKTSISAPKL